VKRGGEPGEAGRQVRRGDFHGVIGEDRDAGDGGPEGEAAHWLALARLVVLKAEVHGRGDAGHDCEALD
jgi:hypothetical protein